MQVPRSFRLLEELEKAEKEGLRDPSLTLGVASRDDIDMTTWSGTIIGPQGTTFDGRFYSLQIICGNDYPNSPPTVRFQTGINLDCVNSANGNVLPANLEVLRNWNSSKTMENIMEGLKAAMLSPQNKTKPQPSEDKTYF